MIEETIARIEAAIKRIDAAKLDKKPELLRLLTALKDEVRQLSKTHAEQARSIASFTEAAAHESLRDRREPALQRLSLEGLGLSVRGFEVSHPKMAQAANGICELLSSIGI